MSFFRQSRRSDLGSNIRVSFEFFPPKTEVMEERLWETVTRLAPLNPEFVSVTYGAGGSTRERTARTIKRILTETDVNAAAHLTCVDATKEEVDTVVREFAAMGVKRFVALRGDPAGGVGAHYKPTPGGYENGADLVAGLKAFADFDISVSAYPEKHPESPDFATDIDMLKRKVDNGATRAITQFRSCRAYCRSIISRRSPISARRLERIFPHGSPSGLMDWIMTRRRIPWSRQRLPPNRYSIWSSAVSRISISTQ
jgi:methylenetetrahydrofolate reductase (NADPH)